MDSSKIESDTKLLLKILPELVWAEVLRYLTTSFQFSETCSEASGFFDTQIQRIGHLFIVSRDKILSSSYHERIDCVPRTTGLILFPEPVLATPQITAMNICMNANFRPINDYLKWLIISQRDSLEKLHISCLGIKRHQIQFKLPEMRKLRRLQIMRNVAKVPEEDGNMLKSLKFTYEVSLPSLESLTLSAFGNENWYDFLLRSNGSQEEPKYPSCHTVQHLRILPARPSHIQRMSFYIAQEKFVFPNLVALEIPAILLNHLIKLFPTPETLKRLTLTLPTRGLHKHLFDVCITGYGEQVCAALLANPGQDPLGIREEIEEENYRQQELFDLYYWERERIKSDNELRREGRRFPNLTFFTGLEELWFISNTGDWGPTLVSCPDLLRMKSLKILRFCGINPKYIPEDMMNKLRERFTIQTPSFNHAMKFNSKIKLQKQSHLEEVHLVNVLSEAIWKQVFRCLSSSFQTVESCFKASDVFKNMAEKSGLLSFNRDKIVSHNFHQWLCSHPEGPLPIPREFPQIKTFDISINSNFQPLGYYLNRILESQRDSIEILHISSLGLRMDCLDVELPVMSKLRDLKIIRDVSFDDERKVLQRSLHFTKSPVVPRLESLALSTIGSTEQWEDFLEKPDESKDPDYPAPTCETVKRLSLLPASLSKVNYTYWFVHQYVFSNLLSLEIPAIHLHYICSMLPSPETLKRLTLTLPSEGLHKHLFDVCITGYGQQVCAAMLATPGRDPLLIREEIEEENFQRIEDIECEMEAIRVRWDISLLRQGHRLPGITDLSGLEELRLISDTGDWGPTCVSCPDLLSMESLKTIHFCGFEPKYIQQITLNQLKERFTVLTG